MPNIENLKKVREKVFKHKYPKKHRAFAGAGLIITDNPNKRDDSAVVTSKPKKKRQNEKEIFAA